MRDHEAAMSAYLQLAVEAHQKRQALARDRLLLLGGVEACRAGWLNVAERCYALHCRFAPGHQLARFASLPDALRNEEFAAVAAHWERWCSYERAEHLLTGLSKTTRPTEAPLDEWLLGELDQMTTDAT